ncbi:MAG: 2-C-methyl-D-erythritol 4-phosphate cytidylyltransferase [Lachnospiraceae bacterium]|nr:2-C-methyl-D-erythritol 4-phosphate cytidylyltransferase [Lachnospiraceae bacterium]
MKSVAIVLAAGSGKRMGGPVKKQFLDLCGKPLIFYPLETFEKSFIDEIIMVIQPEDEEYIREEIVKKYGLSKVSKFVYGGDERYNSVLNGLNAIDTCDYVFIHDGARALIDTGSLERGLASVKETGACVIGMPSKDTVKIADENGIVKMTPDRSSVWNVQTPQIFKFDLIKEAYNNVISHEKEYKDKGINITDDAMVLELYSDHPIKLVEGSYRNFKVTTPEDTDLAKRIIESGMNA